MEVRLSIINYYKLKHTRGYLKVDEFLKELITGYNKKNSIDLQDFDSLIAERCSKALLQDDKYMEMERNNISPDELQARAEMLCYKQGIKDIVAMFLCSQTM